MPPVPAAGSNRVRTAPFLRRRSLSGRKRRSTMRRMTSRGVKWSPASSLAASLNFRTSSSKVRPISRLDTWSGWRSISPNFWISLKRRFVLSSFWICWSKPKLSNRERTSGKSRGYSAGDFGPGFGISFEALEIVLAGVVELLPGGALEHLVDVGGVLAFQFFVLFENFGFRRFENAVEPAEDGHGQHDFAIFGGTIRASEEVGDVPDEAD
jgi:hypothetical protein